MSDLCQKEDQPYAKQDKKYAKQDATSTIHSLQSTNKGKYLRSSTAQGSKGISQ